MAGTAASAIQTSRTLKNRQRQSAMRTAKPTVTIHLALKIGYQRPDCSSGLPQLANTRMPTIEKK